MKRRTAPPLQVGDKVRRDPKVWKPGKWPAEVNEGVVAVADGNDYQIQFGDGRFVWYHRVELEKIS